MKKLLFFVILTMTCLGTAVAQKSPIETVYLKNGSVVKGEIVEQIPNSSIKLRTRDGNIFVFTMDEIERIAREEKTPAPLRGRLYNGTELSLAPSLTIANGATGFGFGLGIGRRYSENFYWGMDIGLPMIGKDFSASLSTTFRPILPIQNTNLDLYVDLVAGISHVGTAEGREFTSLALQIIPGMQYPLSDYVDFRLGAGYTASILLDGGEGTSGAFILQAAFSFHSSTAESNAQQAVIPSGLQITMESGFGSTFVGGGMMPTSIIAGYKLDPKWSLGLGWQRTYCFTGEFDVDNYYGIGFKASWQPGIFLRGQYRFRETGGSPFISLDLGGSVLHVNEEHYVWDDDEHMSSDFGINLYAAPAVGWSWKLGANSTLDLKVGAVLGTSSSGKYTFTPWRESTRTEDCHYNPSSAFIKLGYTQTLNLLTGHGEKVKQKLHIE